MREDQILHVLPRGVRGLLTGKRLKYEYLQEIKASNWETASVDLSGA